MRISAKTLLLGAAILAATGSVRGPLSGEASAQAQTQAPAQVIAERRAGLKRMGEHMQAMKGVVDSKGAVQPLTATVDDMIAWYRTMPTRFPDGTDKGDTRALPALFAERANFETVNGNMVNQLQALRTAAASGDPATFAAAYAQTGQTCGTCHRPYRAPIR